MMSKMHTVKGNSVYNIQKYKICKSQKVQGKSLKLYLERETQKNGEDGVRNYCILLYTFQ